MRTPLIGLTSSQLARSHKRKANLLLAEYTQAICKAGGNPVLIPNEYPLERLDALRAVFDGILLTGGGDIDPAFYSAENDRLATNIVKERDALEKALVEMAVTTDWPLLGICRGAQMLNAALGGTLYTDIARQYDTRITHDQPTDAPPGKLVHEVSIEPGSTLARIINSKAIQVNSRHHQAVKDLAPKLRVTARASDGLIEGIEYPGLRFCLGVQWHPESLPAMAEHRGIFSAFISAASS